MLLCNVRIATNVFYTRLFLIFVYMFCRSFDVFACGCMSVLLLPCLCFEIGASLLVAREHRLPTRFGFGASLLEREQSIATRF